jgi:hypothetical protein
MAEPPTGIHAGRRAAQGRQQGRSAQLGSGLGFRRSGEHVPGRDGPAREQLQAVVGSGAGRRAVHDHGQPGVGRQRHGIVVKLQIADDRMPEALRAVAEDMHIVGAPQDTEDIAAGRQFTDKVRQLAVVGTSLCAKLV